MNRPTKLVLLAGVLVVPSWYVYRSFTDRTVSRLGWNTMFLPEVARLKAVVDSQNEELEGRRRAIENEKRKQEDLAAAEVERAKQAEAAKERRRALTREVEEAERLHRIAKSDLDLWYRDVDSLRTSERGYELTSSYWYELPSSNWSGHMSSNWIVVYEKLRGHPPTREDLERAGSQIASVRRALNEPSDRGSSEGVEWSSYSERLQSARAWVRASDLAHFAHLKWPTC